MPKMHLEQFGFSYSACRPFTENKEKIPKFKETGDSECFYQNELDNACIQHDMAYGNFKNLPRRYQQKSDDLYIKWKDYDNSFDTWIDKEDIVV